WTWLATASGSSALRSSLRSPFGRRKTFSRPSIRMRASDLYLGVIRLTMASESTKASSVGMMIARFFRSSARQIARTSRSPGGGGATLGGAGTGADTVFESGFLYLPLRHNANRIAYSRRTLISLDLSRRLHFIMVAAWLTQPAGAPADRCAAICRLRFINHKSP